MVIQMTLQQRRKLKLPAPLCIEFCEVIAQPPAQCVTEHYNVFEIIGDGTTSVVYRGTRKADGGSVALKTMRTNDDEVGEVLRNEYDVLTQLAHPNIIRALDFHAGAGRYTLVMELFNGPSLEQAVKSWPTRHLQEPVAQHLGSQLFCAVAYLHERQILHRDIKVQNVLVSHDLQDLRLIDFNTAHSLENGPALTMTGTKQFAAPEVLLGESPSESADVWSSGLCLYYMLAGCFPHQAEQCPTLEDFAGVVASRTVSLHGAHWDTVSDTCKKALRRCLEVDKTNRPVAMILLSDPWFSGDHCGVVAGGFGSCVCQTRFATTPTPQRRCITAPIFRMSASRSE
jgi:serine/threonine protein kinase